MDQIPVATTNNQTYVNLDFSSTTVMNENMLLEKFKDIDNMNDHELYAIVRDYYKTILKNIFDDKREGRKSPFAYLFTLPKFIITLTQLMYKEIPDETTKRQLNKMSYDYLIWEEGNKDSYISGLLMSLSKVLNKDKIPRLCNLQLSEDFSSLLLLVRYSSEKEVTNVKRVNRVLLNQSLDSLSEQRIVDIYLSLFDHVLPIFEGVMLDSMPVQNMVPDMQEIYGLITLAALDIFNELPLHDIKKGLIRFNDDRKILYEDTPLRINLESCSSEDYSRLISAIDELRSEGIYISTR